MKFTLEDQEIKKVFDYNYKVALISLLIQTPIFIANVISAFNANAVIVWTQTLSVFQSIIFEIVVLLVTHTLKKDNEEYFNYGFERLESWASFACDTTVLIVNVIIIFKAIYELFNPTLPTNDLKYFIMVQAGYIGITLFFFLTRVKVDELRKSTLNNTQYYKTRNALINVTATTIAGSICYILRNSLISGYLSPIVSLCLGVYLIRGCIKRLINSFKELTNYSISVEDSDVYFDIVLSYKEYFNKINEINCHMLNKKMYVDINIDFKPDITFNKQKELLKELEVTIQKERANTEISFVIK